MRSTRTSTRAAAPRTTHHAALGAAVGVALASLLSACTESPSDGEADALCPAPTDVASTDASEEVSEDTPEVPDVDPAVPLRPQANPSEYTGVAFSPEMDRDALIDLVRGTFGPDEGLPDNVEVTPGVFFSVAPDDRTPEQVVVTVAMEVSTDSEPSRRTLFQGPASRAYGEVFADAVEAAIVQMERTREADPGDVRGFRLEHRIRSANGGQLAWGVDFDRETLRLVFDVQTPRTSLLLEDLNEPALAGDPYETVYGLVTFDLSRDNFDFFVNRAYGLSAGANQNFADFRLLPHDWLRLTVTPLLDDEMVDVGFEIITPDGDRVPIARAPASVRAGEQFMQNVLLMVDMMAAQEELEPGSSPSWTSPFYYDDPQGGGVVEVIATGQGGEFTIAYAVETPARFLRDVPFVPYQGEVVIPDDWDAVDPTCADLGSTAAAQGFFHVTFDASSTVRNSSNIEGELRGPVWGSVFRAEDVTLAGPNPGAEAVASFHYPEVDLRDGPSDVFVIDQQLLAGEYQILGFMDTDGNADPENPDPDTLDPVFIPIGAYPLQCDVQPTNVEFALLRP